MVCFVYQLLKKASRGKPWLGLRDSVGNLTDGIHASFYPQLPFCESTFILNDSDY